MRSTTGWSERSTPKCQNIPTRPLSDAHRAQATSVRKYGPPLGATVRKCLPTSARPQHTPPPAPPRLTETNQTFRGMHHDRSNTASTSRAFATHLRRALATALALLSDQWSGLVKKIAFFFGTVVMAIMRQPGQLGHMRGHHGPAWGLQGSLCYREWPRVPVACV